MSVLFHVDQEEPLFLVAEHDPTSGKLAGYRLHTASPVRVRAPFAADHAIEVARMNSDLGDRDRRILQDLEPFARAHLPKVRTSLLALLTKL
jgi:hypothetical protein